MFSAKQSVLSFLAIALLLGVAFLAYTLRIPEEVPVVTLPLVEEESEPVSEDPRITIVGTSVEGRPIELYTYGTGDTHLLFVGGVHGGYEWNSVLLAYAFIDHLTAKSTSFPSDLTVGIIPNLNPDGTFAVVGKEGRFTFTDVTEGTDTTIGRFNAHGVDLNRNFDCKWQPKSTWRGNIVSAGTSAFSEPEARALRAVVTEFAPTGVVFWHSKANAVYASECENGILPETRTLMVTYATAANYTTVDVFDAYPVTGDAEGWLASIGIPAITVELATHENLEWEKNLAGMNAVLDAYSIVK
jgi:hypothetical protein